MGRIKHMKLNIIFFAIFPILVEVDIVELRIIFYKHAEIHLNNIK